MKKLLLSLLGITFFLSLTAQPKTEIRAVWLTTNYALDWPQTLKTENTQKNRLKNMLDMLQEININTIIFQVQCRSDVFWDSKHQPWSRHITGTSGLKPGYDVLQFVIDECRERNMEVHAWIVPYPLGSQAVANLIGDDHVSVKKPELCIYHGGEWYLDPGLPATTDYLIDLYTELVEAYDFDGINLDYTRYPGADFPDDNSYKIYGNGMNKADWRRLNINNFVHKLYDMMQEKKPGIKLGAAPVGAYESLPEAYSGFTARDHLFQDPIEWAASEKLDLIVPQVYWQLNYEPQLANWIKKSNNRPVVAGLAAYKMLPPADGESWAATVITEQIELARDLNASGICFFRTQQITDNYKNIYDLLKEDAFKYPANIPPASWYGVNKPNAPQNVSISKKEDTYTISWDAPALNDEVPIKYYTVYSSETENIDIENVKNIAAHYIKDTAVDITLSDLSQIRYFTVTAFDKGYYESDPSETVNTGINTSINDRLKVFNVDFIQRGNNIYITSGLAIQSVQCYTLNGVMLSNKSYNDRQIIYDCNTFEKGVYILVVSLQDGSVFKHKVVR